MNEHVSADLSAYLDQELAPSERGRVSAHLEGCGQCSSQLAELRATATLMAALPALRPSGSLAPSLAPKWNWLRPMRSFSAVTSGAFLMVFLVAAVAQSGSDLGGGSPSPLGPTAAQAPAPAAATAAGAPEAATTELRAAPPASPEAAGQQAAETPATFSTNSGAAEDAAARQDELADAQRASGDLDSPPTPLIWLGLALIAAIVAFAAHWRLRAA